MPNRPIIGEGHQQAARARQCTVHPHAARAPPPHLREHHVKEKQVGSLWDEGPHVPSVYTGAGGGDHASGWLELMLHIHLTHG